MLLAIDAGNSYVKYGYHDGGTWLNQYRVPLQEFCNNPKHYLQMLPKQIVIANVAGPRFQSALESAFPGVSLQWINAKPQARGVANLYQPPDQLGADRWVTIIAAREAVKQPFVVASLGTALTVDTVAGDGRFLGGVIMPGLQLMRSALANGTHAVQAPNGQVTSFPTNTADAVETGLIYAIQGVIEKNITELEKFSQRPVLCILTGGCAHLIASYLNRPVQVMDNLVLDGLRLLARREDI